MNDSKTVKTPVCVVLLDHSESMGKTFQEKKAHDFLGTTQVSNAQIKLDAAKESLIKYISDFQLPKRLILVECGSNASVIFDGLSDNQDKIQEILSSLKANNSVSSVSAIEIIKNHIKDNNYTLVRFLIISDKLQYFKPIVNNKNIDLILIDPTYKIQRFASLFTDTYGSVSMVLNLHYAPIISVREAKLKAKLEAYLTDIREYTQSARPPSARSSILLSSFLLPLIILGLIASVVYGAVTLLLTNFSNNNPEDNQTPKIEKLN